MTTTAFTPRLGHAATASVAASLDWLPYPRHAESGQASALHVDAALRRALTTALTERASAGPIRLVLDPAFQAHADLPANCRDQAYRLTVSARRVTITAAAPPGLFYGLQTLRQTVEASAEGAVLPTLEISDGPDLPWRGLQLDIARGLTYRHEHVKDIVRTMAGLKMNLLHLYLEGRFAYPSHPELHGPGLMTPDEARDLARFAREHHVTLVPQVNGLGHMANILSRSEHAHLREDPGDAYMICPSHPEARSFVFGLVDDLMDAFETPFVHIGMDEVAKLGFCPRCRARIQADGHPGRLLAEHINAIAGRVRERGRRALIWGDMLLDKAAFPGAHAANGGVTGWGSRNQTASALDYLDRDIVICDWEYAYFTPAEMSHFRRHGFDIMPAIDSDERGCPWGPANGLDVHLRGMFGAARENDALGAYTCTWSLQMGEVFHNRWLDFAKTAESLWSARPWEPAELAASAGRVLFGLEPPLLGDLDKGIKRNVLPPTMRLVPNRMRLDRPWAILEPPAGAQEPVRPAGDVSMLVGFKEQMLSHWRQTCAQARRNRVLLEALDIPLRVDTVAAKMLALRGTVRAAYAHAASAPGEPLVATWCRKSVMAGIAGLLQDVETLAERLREAHRLYGNDAKDVDRAQAFAGILRGLLGVLQAADGLPPLDAWCPEPLR